MGESNDPRQHPGADAPTAYPIDVVLRDGSRVTIRPIGPDDEAREQAFVRGLSAESRYFRFMNTLRELSPGMLHRFTDPDPAREVALVAVAPGPPVRQVGVARFARGEPGTGEFAIVVADDLQGKGLGSRLMQELLASARAGGLQQLEGSVVATNHRMLALMQAFGFDISTPSEDPRVRRVVKRLA